MVATPHGPHPTTDAAAVAAARDAKTDRSDTQATVQFLVSLLSQFLSATPRRTLLVSK